MEIATIPFRYDSRRNCAAADDEAFASRKQFCRERRERICQATGGRGHGVKADGEAFVPCKQHDPEWWE
jgi:hypothetical protein